MTTNRRDTGTGESATLVGKWRQLARRFGTRSGKSIEPELVVNLWEEEEAVRALFADNVVLLPPGFPILPLESESSIEILRTAITGAVGPSRGATRGKRGKRPSTDLLIKLVLDVGCIQGNIGPHTVNIQVNIGNAGSTAVVQTTEIPRPSAQHVAARTNDASTPGDGGPPTCKVPGDVVDFLLGVERFFMSQHIVAGKYVRYVSEDVEHLKSEAFRLVDACTISTRDRENFFVWGHPGEGKTFFVSQVAKEHGIRYVEINVNDTGRVPDVDALTRLLSEAVESGEGVLCALDEVDKRCDTAEWLYSAMFTFLDFNMNKSADNLPNKVFVLIGSKQPDYAAFLAKIGGRDGGPDLLRRVTHPEITIPRLNVGDRMATALSMIWAAHPENRKIVAVSKMALAYLLAENSTNGAIADATKRALGHVKVHETTFTAHHLDLNIKAWDSFHERYPTAKGALFKAFVQLHP